MVKPNFKVVQEKKDQYYGKFVIEPLEPGFGNTLGLALRRVLLTSIEGAAITSVKIEGVKHRFSTIKGLKEDVIGLILNIKGVQVKLADSKSEAKITLSKSGPGDIKASHIEVTDGVEIKNPDHYIGSLSDKSSKLDLEMTIGKGFGYSTAEERKTSTLGIIPIDAIFSPIVKVSYKVEQTRVGRQTNYDKLILELWTNGTADAKLALEESSKILVSYFLQVYEPKAELPEEKIAIDPLVSEDVLKMTIEELDLPTRIYNSLKNAGIETVGQLLGTPRRDLMNYRNLGAKSIGAIEEVLRQKGISLNL